MGLLWRPLRLADASAWSALTALVAKADNTSKVYTADDLAEELEDPSISLASDTIAVLDGAQLVAVGQVYPPVRRVDGGVRSLFEGAVHPAFRGRGIGSELLTRLETRVVQLTIERFPDAEVQPSTDGSPAAHDAIALLAARGYRPVRYFAELTHDLRDLQDVDETGLVDYDAGLDAAVHAAHCAAFADHWGSAPPGVDRWAIHYTGSRTLRPGCSTVALAADGTVLGYVLSYEYQPEQVWFGQVGVLAQARKRGLATRMLRRSLAAARAAGYRSVALDVDSENPDGATGIYESVGFGQVRTNIVYRKQ